MNHDGFYHGKLDAYAQSLIDQNAGGVCKYCSSALGHYARCPLIQATIIDTFPSGDDPDVAELNKIFALEDLRGHEATNR